MVSILNNKKVFDCFLYFDEDVLLNLRLNILNKYVDYFVIIESIYNHKGKKKKLNFKINNFKKFKKKIIYIQSKDRPKKLKKIFPSDTQSEINSKNILNAYRWENFNRNEIIKGLKSAKNDDIIILSDLDEIPNLSKIDFDKINNNIFFFRQKVFYYKLNLKYPNIDWYGSRICKKKFLKSPQWLRNLKTKKYPFWRLDVFFSRKKYFNIKFVDDGGWHFTNLKTPKDILKKYKNYLHWYEFELNKINLNTIKKLIEKRMVLYDLNKDQRSSLDRFKSKTKLIKANKFDLPMYILQNKKKYKKWFVN